MKATFAVLVLSIATHSAVAAQSDPMQDRHTAQQFALKQLIANKEIKGKKLYLDTQYYSGTPTADTATSVRKEIKSLADSIGASVATSLDVPKCGLAPKSVVWSCTKPRAGTAILHVSTPWISDENAEVTVNAQLGGNPSELEYVYSLQRTRTGWATVSVTEVLNDMVLPVRKARGN